MRRGRFHHHCASLRDLRINLSGDYENRHFCKNPIAADARKEGSPIHHGHNEADRPDSHVVLREIVDVGVRMYPVWWENDRFYKYLAAATGARGVIPLGRLGLYKYITMDSTYSMVLRLLSSLDRYLGADAGERLEILRHVRGDWSE